MHRHHTLILTVTIHDPDRLRAAGDAFLTKHEGPNGPRMTSEYLMACLRYGPKAPQDYGFTVDQTN